MKGDDKMGKTKTQKQFGNIKVEFINVPTEYDEEYEQIFTPETIKKLEEFERLIISDLHGSNIRIKVDFEKPYHAIGYDWIIPKKECIKCVNSYEISGMHEVSEEKYICEECYKNKVK